MAKKSLSRSAGVVGIAVLGSRVLGLVREVVFTTLFGAGKELDAFIAAFRIPNLLRDLFAEGALSAAFVSTFSQKLDREGDVVAWKLASRVVNDLLIVVGGVVLLGVIFAPAIVDVMAPGFRAEPGKTELTVLLTRILFPFLLFVALAAVAMGVLNARSVFGVPASASSFFNLGSILGGLAFAWWLAPQYVGAVVARLGGTVVPIPEGEVRAALIGLTLGTLVGGLLQFLVQVPSLRSVGFHYHPVAGFRDAGVQQVLRLMGPATIGIAAVQVNVVVNTYFASELGNGPVSWLNVAFRLMYLPIGMFGVALGTAVLPAVARAASRDNMPEFREHLGEALRLLLLLCIPAAVGLALVSGPVIAMVYEHGRFAASDTRAAAQALSAYSIGLTGYAAIKILGPAFYAIDDARTPMRVSLLAVAINFVLNWTAVRVLGLGHLGLALSTSVVALWNSALLFVLLRERVGSLRAGFTLHVVRTAAATAVMAFACWAWMAWIDSGERSFAGEFRTIATTLPLGVVVFYAAGRAAGIPELRQFSRVLIPRGRRSP